MQEPTVQPSPNAPEPSQQPQNLIVNTAYPNLAYDPREGWFYRSKVGANGATILTKAELEIGNMLGVCVVDLITNKKKHTNRKAAMLAWELVNGKPWPEDHAILFRNLDLNDLSAFNIVAIHKDQYKQIKDAIDNLNGTLRVQPDPREAYRYKVRYKIKGVTTHKYFWDITEAKRFKRLVLIKSTRLLNKYIATN